MVDRNPDEPTQPIGPLPGAFASEPPTALPGMFPTEAHPSVGRPAWSEPELGPESGMLPGWSGTHTVEPVEAGRDRRRRALLAVGGVALAAAVIMVIAMLVSPGRHTGTPDSADRASSTVPPVPPTAAQVTAPPVITAPTASASATAGPPLTVTVTASATGPVTASGSPATSTPTTTKTTATTRTTATSTVKKDPLGVPQRDIPCGGGYIVQLASEVNADAFTKRVAALKAAGQVPAGSFAADSTRSCQIFSGQVNTLVLYAGPFSGPYDGCAARLGGPADAFIRGQSADTSHKYVSCLCPASAGALPRINKVGEQHVWIGELQRVLGNRLNMDIGDVGNSWGTYTEDTKDAVARFQKSARLKDNGKVDARTWQALQQASCG